MGPREFVHACGEWCVCTSCCTGKGVSASLLQICIPADFYFRPCLFLPLKCGCYAKSHTRISCKCVILQLLLGCFCDLGSNKGTINKQQQRQFSKEASELSPIPFLAPFPPQSRVTSVPETRVREAQGSRSPSPESARHCPLPPPG